MKMKKMLAIILALAFLPDIFAKSDKKKAPAEEKPAETPADEGDKKDG